jgi:methylenetetrahydrofolate reductase (NADPH)
MNKTERKCILVISHDPGDQDIARKATDGLDVIYAANEADGLEQIQTIRPDIILLGDLKLSLSDFYSNLKKGWISHHASLLALTDITKKDDQLIPRLRDNIARILRQRENHLKSALLAPDNFCLVWEQIPGPGAFEARQELALENSRKAAQSGIVSAISVTDNPGGNPAIATDVLCAEIKKAGIDPLVHIAFRDKNRNQAESLLFQLAALDINNVLILTGDYPSNLGFTGKSKPVFDLDSVNGLRLVAEMNRGLEREIMRKTMRLAPTSFFAGSAISPFKRVEAEAMGQYYKLEKKIAAGTDFLITQVGFDARKMHELLMWLRVKGHPIPALAGIYVLTYPVAKTMRDNNIPGCVVTDKLLSRIAAESESKDKGKQARLDRAAKMYAIAKGMGYKGAYVSGQGLPFESLNYIVEKGNELANNWMELLPEFDFPQENGFYFFERDPKTGLNSTKPAARPQKSSRPMIFIVSHFLHKHVFEPKSPLFKLMQKLMLRIDSSPFLLKIFHHIENCSKVALYHCKDCGDCALFDTAYLCPVSQCPKDQRNGPCGGSCDGWCEVYPGKQRCIWVQAYDRLKTQGKEDEIGKYILPPCNWELWQTSSWINYFLGRDHSDKKFEV